MVKIPAEKIDKEVKQQEADVYGTPYTDGESPDLDSPEEMLENSIGNSPLLDVDGFSIAKEQDKDAHAIRDDEPEDSEEDVLQRELGNE
ncbi:hypothetical protein C4564_05895 [Candidatus Microgenomates bacterium]|nr:MAG: hypothetical protein C4564_05895 [Candidatus Microgenomates bacterium]